MAIEAGGLRVSGTDHGGVGFFANLVEIVPVDLPIFVGRRVTQLFDYLAEPVDKFTVRFTSITPIGPLAV